METEPAVTPSIQGAIFQQVDISPQRVSNLRMIPMQNALIVIRVFDHSGTPASQPDTYIRSTKVYSQASEKRKTAYVNL